METQFSLVMKERNRLAREIHDSLAQGLAAIGLHVSAIQTEQSEDARARHAQKARELVDANLAEARRSVWDLHPQSLDQQDLVSALRRLAADLDDPANTRVRVRSSGPPVLLSSDTEKNVFRIVQEAVANAVRHAAARQIDIDLRVDRGRVRITIADDGRGFDAAALSDGFGLTSMRERATHIGAVLHIESHPMKGTSLAVAVPMASPKRPRMIPGFVLRRIARTFRSAPIRRV
jgi:signal transduction histidine kinase